VAQSGKRRTTRLIWLFLVAVFVALFVFYDQGRPGAYRDFAAFRADVAKGRVTAVRVSDNQVCGDST
jgi:multidrug resistance efflux pump